MLKRIVKYIIRIGKLDFSKISYWADIDNRSIIGRDCIVLKNTTICRSILEDSVSIANDSHIINSQIKKNSQIFNHTVIDESVIGDHVKIRSWNEIRHCHIDHYSYTGYNNILSHTKIGKFCSIGPDVKIGLGLHPTDLLSTNPIFYSTQKASVLSFSKENTFDEHVPVLLGNDVWIGANVLIKDGIVIGNGAIIGSGSVVTSNIEPYSVVGGIPAKLIRMRFQEDVIARIERLNWWDYDIEYIKKNLPIFQKKPLDINVIESIFKKND